MCNAETSLFRLEDSAPVPSPKPRLSVTVSFRGGRPDVAVIGPGRRVAFVSGACGTPTASPSFSLGHEVSFPFWDWLTERRWNQLHRMNRDESKAILRILFPFVSD